jgi:hypothetical protein
VGSDFALGKFADGLSELLLFLGKREIHGSLGIWFRICSVKVYLMRVRCARFRWGLCAEMRKRKNNAEFAEDRRGR